MKTNIRNHILWMHLLCASTIFAQTDTVTLQLKSEIPFAILGLPQKVLQDQLGRPFCYVAAKEGGLRIFSIQNIAAPVLVKTLPPTDFLAEEVMNIWQEGNYLYLALGNFFNTNDPRRPGLAIVDITAPEAAFTTDTWLWATPVKGSAFVTVSGNYAYLGAMSNGLIILDVSNKDTISFVSQYTPDIHFPVQNPNSIQLPNVRGMAVRDDVVFLCYDAGGLRVINVSDKSNPVESGRYININALGKQQAYNNIVLHGDTAFLAVDFCGMEMLDISDTSSIKEISWWNPWDCQSATNTWLNSPGHANQLDYDAARQLVFLSTGRSELNIVDVSNPTQPQQVGSYGSPTDTYFTWGASLHGDRIYLAYISSLFPFFSTWSGVKVLEWDATSGAGEAGQFFARPPYPNPFEERFYVEFELKEPAELLAELFDRHGKKVANVASGDFGAGAHILAWEGNLPPGLYVLRLLTPKGSLVLKMVRVGE